MPKAKTPSFIVELPIFVSSEAGKQLDASFSAATRLTNVMIQAGRTIVSEMRGDPDWAIARKLPAKTKPQIETRRVAFAALRKKYGFSEFDFHKAIAKHKNTGAFASRVGSNVAQKLATRVFKSFEEYVFAKRGLPRFKNHKRPLRSLEEKNMKTGIRWDAEKSEVLFSGLRLPAIMPDLKKDEWLAFSLQHKTKYCRLCWRNVNGMRRYFIQLIQEGDTPIKASVQERMAPVGTVGGFDLGPSNIAWVTDVEAGLVKFCAEVEVPQAHIRRLQRKVDRQRRAGNPENFAANGQVKVKVRLKWLTSRSQRNTEKVLVRVQNTLARQRKNSQGVLSNDLMAHARSWRDDGVSVKSLQKNYGKSIGARAPGMFLDLISRKAERAGGSRIKQSARVLKTSQYDHSTCTYTKKPLSLRWHVFGDGRGKVQRDIYSAFLARNACQRIDEDGVIGWAHDPKVLEEAWTVLSPTLEKNGWFVGEGLGIEPVRA